MKWKVSSTDFLLLCITLLLGVMVMLQAYDHFPNSDAEKRKQVEDIVAQFVK